ncbi:RNA-guided endonuclease TnpB family protein [Mycolicibacter sp. MYC123]|uniref:RNA-guided endonuclease TnpB family protein n=1 Tax=[Mycobacterium] zoologicum TaxID=2872311 RepID=A0ABU5YEA4_9MYCO|nr:MULTISPECIES: RNA-guided endonuclease TnpB family protein [unclassified Mycolicibacter]MEB3048381.1 RNA-guided endonuclease TnpB family protein [Mycolicibacter sp. MYC123]MEB3063829.1 RNA-guided endonuclease TnpB family protein [Mycolicibacter sp. MYC101]
MARHTTFKFCLDPTVEQGAVLSRHAGAARFAFNQCLRLVKTGLTDRKTDPDTAVPWTGFDLINAFNGWKKTEAAGRVFTVDTDGVAETVVTGLAWRTEVCQQVFEEAAVDLGRGLKAWSDSRSGKRKGRSVGFPRFKKKTTSVPSFRLRNKHSKVGSPAIRIGGGDRPRSIILPGIGRIAVHDDTRRLRRMLATDRAKILFTTVTERAGRWRVSLNIEAADLHPALRHRPRPADGGGWVGVDRGLAAFVVAATAGGVEVARIADAPKALAAGIARQRRLAKSLSRKQKGSRNRRDAAARLARHHHRVATVRRHFAHQVSNQLVKTHDRLVIENLHVAGMLRNHRLARAISDAGWAEFARQLHYKQGWRGGQVIEADRWYPSSQLCSTCADRRTDLSLAERVFTCPRGHRLDRDLNAAVNLARWGQTHHDSHRTPDPQAGGRATNARRQDGSDQHPTSAGETSLEDAGTNVHTAPAA